MSDARRTWLLSVLAFCLAPGGAMAQDSARTSAVVLSVTGDVPRPVKWTASEFARLPRQSVRGKDRDGKEVGFEGVPLVEVLKTAGVKFGQDLRGPALANYLVVEAADGYRAVRAARAGSGLHRPRHPPRRPAGGEAVRRERGAPARHRPGREAADAMGQAGRQPQGRPGRASGDGSEVRVVTSRPTLPWP